MRDATKTRKEGKRDQTEKRGTHYRSGTTHVRCDIKRACVRAVRVMIASLASGTPRELRVSMVCMCRAMLQVAYGQNGASEIQFQLMMSVVVRLSRVWGGHDAKG